MNEPATSADQRWSLPLIHTKLSPPRPPRGRVSRSSLLDRLTTAVARSVHVVSAPAGFGKTTLLAEACEALRAQQHRVAWLSLDADDDDVQLFGAYLVAAFRSQPGGVGERAQAVLRDDPSTPVKTVVAVLLNEIAACERQVWLVLDDFDRLVSQPIRALVARALRYASPNLHVLLGVRSEAGLGLGLLHGDQRLSRLDAADLRFSIDDAQAFFAQAGEVALDRASVELLNGATEGWVAGLQMAALGLQGAGDAERVAQDLTSARFGIGAYLDDAVLARLPSAVQQFLLRTSILDRLSAGVCDAVVGAGARSGQKLEWLERRNVFIRALDDEHRWFRLHALMSDALRRAAERQLRDDLPGLHRRASRWFAEQRLWPEAVRHALAAGDTARAAAWVEAIAMAQVDRSDVRTLLGWLSRLPERVIDERLPLKLAKAWALALAMRVGDAAKAVEALQADRAAGRHAEADGDAAVALEIDALKAAIAGFADQSTQSLELGRLAATAPVVATPHVRRFAETAQLFGLAYAGGFDEIRRMRAAAPRDDDQPALYGDVYRASMFGLGALVEGRLPEAARIFEAALAHAEKAVGRDSAAAALPAGYLAAIYDERGEFDRADSLVADRSATVMQASPLGSVLCFCRTAARLYARRGDVASALIVLADARELALARGWLRLRAGCDAEAVRLHLREGRLAAAEQTLAELLAAMPDQPPSPMGSYLVTWDSTCSARARLAIARGHPEHAVPLLEALRSSLAAAGMWHAEAAAALLLARAHEAAGSRPAALAALGDALRFAQTVGMIGSFVDEDAGGLELLLTWQRDAARAGPVDAAFVERLLAAARPAAPLPAAAAAVPPAASPLLSQREVEILHHISRGLSNKEIARALRVAPETIKWHLKKVFDKLDVGSRVEAVQRGLGYALDGPTQ